MRDERLVHRLIVGSAILSALIANGLASAEYFDEPFMILAPAIAAVVGAATVAALAQRRFR